MKKRQDGPPPARPVRNESSRILPVPPVVQARRTAAPAPRVLQCTLQPGTHVQVNDVPPWFGKIIAVNGTVSYQVQVGGTNRVREIPQDKAVLHPAVLAQRVTTPVVRPPSLFEIGTYVKVNDTPLWYGQIVDWKGRGIYRVRFGGTNLVKDVPEGRLELHSAFAARSKVHQPDFHVGTHVVLQDGAPLYGKVTAFNPKTGRYEVRIGGMERTIEVEANRLDQAHPTARLTNATYIPFARARSLNPDTTLVMRAQNTGDMYHVKASLAIHPEYNLLLWNVNPQTRAQAQQVVDVLGDLLRRPGSRQRVFYTEKNSFPSHLKKTETHATREVEEFFERAVNLTFTVKGTLQNPGAKKLQAGMLEKVKLVLDSLGPLYRHGDLSKWVQESYRRLAIEDLSRRFAFYTEEEGREFERDLAERGHFRKGRRYVIVNFRATGHSDRPGANAPALDTGLTGVLQIIGAVRDALGSGVQVVPMGEEPRSLSGGPNLLNYWEWPSARDRRKQAALLKYLNDHYNLIGVIGMRSGVMDQLAFSGIKIISIDISPHRYDRATKLPDLSTSKGWSRGLKLESALHGNYGRVFLMHHRVDEATRKLPRWEGAFQPEDLEAIRDSVAFYFGGGSRGELQHPTHPNHPSSRDRALREVRAVLDRALSGYELINNIHPYLRELWSHLRGSDKGLAKAVEGWVAAVKKEIVTREKNAAQEITKVEGQHHGRTIDWMQQNQKRALLEDRTGDPHYAPQKTWIAKQLEVPDEDRGLRIYRAYQEAYSRKAKVPIDG